jgi:hypothetical protein
MTRQYFWDDEWHDEGTGPLSDESESFALVASLWRDKPAPKWLAAVMPLDATDPDSLVGRMLGVGEVPPVLPEDGSSLPVLTEDVLNGEPLPLWRVMQEAYDTAPRVCMNQEGHCHAAEIEAVRDWLPTVPSREFLVSLGLADRQEPAQIARCTIEWLRGLLTQQARIARGEE